MIRRQRNRPEITATDRGAYPDFHDWVLSLPWVTERPYSLGTPGVRSFAVECEPLARSQLLLVSGLRGAFGSDGMGLAVIVPRPAAAELEAADLGHVVAPMPAGRAVVAVHDGYANRDELEMVVLTAYGCAMS
jgi:hypothetical protein